MVILYNFSTEFSFWNNRLKNLSFIYDQLRNERIRAMALILEYSMSAYHPCFQTLFKNVVTGECRAAKREFSMPIGDFRSSGGGKGHNTLPEPPEAPPPAPGGD